MSLCFVCVWYYLDFSVKFRMQHIKWQSLIFLIKKVHFFKKKLILSLYIYILLIYSKIAHIRPRPSTIFWWTVSIQTKFALERARCRLSSFYSHLTNPCSTLMTLLSENVEKGNYKKNCLVMESGYSGWRVYPKTRDLIARKE